jgi:hypothetical protein
VGERGTGTGTGEGTGEKESKKMSTMQRIRIKNTAVIFLFSILTPFMGMKVNVQF